MRGGYEVSEEDAFYFVVSGEEDSMAAYASVRRKRRVGYKWLSRYRENGLEVC